MTETLQQVLAKINELPGSEQDRLVGLMLHEIIRRENRARAKAYNAQLWARMREEDPQWIEDWNALHRHNAEKAEHFVRLVLLVDWDPIGVFGNSGTEDEYDRYVPGVYRLLRSSPTNKEVIDHLYGIERGQMEIGGKYPLARKAVLSQVAQKLLDLSALWYFNDPGSLDAQHE